MPREVIQVYLKTLDREIRAGNSTEQTHRPAIKTLIEALAAELHLKITATNEPKRIACGAPDLVLTGSAAVPAAFKRKQAGETPALQSANVPLGHVETKDVGSNLDEAERGRGPHGEQFLRYRSALPNWVLTDYLRFDWFVAGERRATVTVAQAGEHGKLQMLPGGPEDLARLFSNFFSQQAPTVATAPELARRLAAIAQLTRDAVLKAFQMEPDAGWLHTWLKAFREVLIPELAPGAFADMFAQTLCYGLFAAKMHAGSGHAFTREIAAYNLPKTNPFLRKLFAEVVGVDLPDELAWAVDEIISLLQHSEMSEILRDFGKGQGKSDPVVHFYETFLEAYDPEIRELRGVYYTPEAVVSYLVRSVDYLLKSRFGRNAGLADEQTLILDPAAGTATFLYFVIRHVYESLARQRGAWDGPQGYVSRHLLNRVFGFELLMAPYAVAHLKLGFELEQTGYTFGSDQRLGIYLTNTLEEAARKSETLFGRWISDEADAAAAIKKTKPIMVVIGNPPYSGHSANRSWETRDGKKVPTFIGSLVQDYFRADGKPLGERNPKWLQDDYVKFIRWGQWRIERTGQGVLALITNHGYLDNPTFRGMRQQLMNAFDEIYVLDLHGNTKKKEQAPGGSKDENVFDIQQGVAIGIFVKRSAGVSPASSFLNVAGTAAPRRSAGVSPAFENNQARGMPALRAEARGMPALRAEARGTLALRAEASKTLAFKNEQAGKMPALRTPQVYHAELWGTRRAKYDALSASDIGSTPWRALKPDSPFYLFVPQNISLREEYERGWKITDAMPVGSLGITTARDDLAIAFDQPSLLARLRDFAGLPPETARAKYQLGKDARDWKVPLAQKDLHDHGTEAPLVKPILYRPFDTRVTYYTGQTRGLICMPRREVMRHMLAGENLGLCTGREVNGDFRHALCANSLTNDCTVSLQSRERTYLFPLYLHKATEKPAAQGAFAAIVSSVAGEPRQPNFNPAFIADLEKRLRSAGVPPAFKNERAGKMPALRGAAPDVALPSRRHFGEDEQASEMPALQGNPAVPAAVEEGSKEAGRMPALRPEDAFYYIYAIFYSPSYRERYAEFLKTDFPRVPLTSSTGIFQKLCRLGEQLVELHLLRSASLDALITAYPQDGSNIVESPSPRYFAPGEPEPGTGKPLPKGRVYINQTQYFEGIPAEVWEFHIGGYQVCEKWLKDRRGRALSYDDTQHYQKVVLALHETIRLMEEIDAAIEAEGGWPLL